jgi:hypothetical protein
MLARIARGLAPAILIALPRPAAAAPDLRACAAAYEDAQVAMRHSHLLAARDAVTQCLMPACPAWVRVDCDRWLKEIEARLPSVVLECTGADGAAIADATVMLDGALWGGRLEGKATEIDPGEHVFHVERAGSRAVDARFIVSEGAKAQRVHVGLASIAAEAPRAALPPPPEAEESPRARPIPWTVYALGALGVAAAGGFTYFGLRGSSGESDLKACEPRCADSAVDAVRAKYLTADVLLGVSVVAFTAAAVIFFTRGDASPSRATARVR